jgi:acetylornithine/N-succinyldiaminopimelate aminotransferase
MREHRLLSVSAGENVIRLMPPLIIEESHVEEAIGILDTVAASFPK